MAADISYNNFRLFHVTDIKDFSVRSLELDQNSLNSSYFVSIFFKFQTTPSKTICIERHVNALWKEERETVSLPTPS